MLDWNLIVAVISLVGTIAAGLCGIVWWLSNRFSEIRKLVNDRVESIRALFTDKLEYHERHDDQRFATITNDLWAIRIRNAARDGIRVEEIFDKEDQCLRPKSYQKRDSSAKN